MTAAQKQQIKPLETEFIGRGEVKGFKLTQIKVTDWGFIYEVVDGGRTYYEVFLKRINTRYGNVSYPSSKQFSKTAWWTRTLEGAEEKLNSVKPKGA